MDTNDQVVASSSRPREEMLYYLGICGMIFANIMEERNADETIDGPFCTALYRMELCTRALLLYKLKPVRGLLAGLLGAALILRSGVDVECPDLELEWDQLKQEMQLCSLCYQRSWKEMAVYLYDAHSGYLRDEGFDVSRIAQMLDIVESEPDCDMEYDASISRSGSSIESESL